MRAIGNFFWFVLIGLWSAIAYAVLGIVWCITIIGIPFGLQAFKFAKLVVAPFGKTVHEDFGAHPIANFIWMILGGFAVAIVFFLVSVLLCLTIVGIPAGIQCFKLAKLSLMPFGADVI